MKLSFLGAAGTVTGSKYLIEYQNRKILVDCGLFQGLKQLRLMNWQNQAFDASEIDAVILTHAHLDHSGYLPLLVNNGFRGDIYCSFGTYDLCKILLPDSGRIQQEDADDANYRQYSKHHPALPLYTEEDAFECLKYFKPIGYDKSYNLAEHFNFYFRRNGHIIGSAAVIISYNGKKIVFSGDLGRKSDPIMKEPEKIDHADYLVVESTYGGTVHKNTPPEDQLEKIINETYKKGGKVIIPSFAVGRAQALIYYLSKLIAQDRIPKNMPAYLDSPMSTDATEVFRRHPEDHILSHKQCAKIFSSVGYVKTINDSKKIMLRPEPSIIISASGMATGGRVLHHLEYLAPDERNTIVLAGYQAEGTRGHRIFIGEKEIKIHGKMVPIKARVEMLENISAHADSSEMLDWIGNFHPTPKIFITHGEKKSSLALQQKINNRFSINSFIPVMGESFEI
ncbi:MAG TPA: MBL fold metallo-hydrolase [Alphaproteobacteria bacterium]|nr:MBL fold metallo-hydrolase [Alphaproteobacteria bacterium]